MPEYEELLNSLERSRPRLATKLVRAHENRRARIAQLLDGARLKGLEQLLGALDQVAERFELFPTLRSCAPLVRRASADFETAIEASLSGFMGVLNDAMRDVMEIELLFWDFGLDPGRIEEWLRADTDARWERYRPAAIRRRLKGAGLVTDHQASADYRGHSQYLHVTPTAPDIAQRGLADDTTKLFDLGFFEIFYHAGSIWGALTSLATSVIGSDQDAVPTEEELSDVTDAWWRIKMMVMLYGYPIPSKESGDDDGSPETG